MQTKQSPLWLKTSTTTVVHGILYKASRSSAFRQSEYDHCLFVMHEADLFVALLVYVDDIPLPCNHHNRIEEIKQFLHTEFTIEDLGQTDLFLGVEVYHTPQGIMVAQHKYILDILVRQIYWMPTNVIHIFLWGCKLHSKDGASLDNSSKYRRLVGRLILQSLDHI